MLQYTFVSTCNDQLVREHLTRPAESEVTRDVWPVADRVLHQLLDIDLSLKRRNETRELVNLYAIVFRQRKEQLLTKFSVREK